MIQRVNNSARQNQVIENKIDDQVSRAVSSAVMTVENRMHDAILAAIDNLINPRVEMTVKSQVRQDTGQKVKSKTLIEGVS